MTAQKSKTSEELTGNFGFEPRESAAHFLVHIPTSAQHAVEISEHLSWDEQKISVSQHYGTERPDGQVRVRLSRPKWNDIADAVRAEFNTRLKRQGYRPGRWKIGYNPVVRTLGKELVLLAWAIEDADPSLTRTAVANWQGLSPEERWWMYTMTAAATGHAQTGRGVGWRKAVRYALTENPATHRLIDQPMVPEFYRLAAAADGSLFGSGQATSDPPHVDVHPEQALNGEAVEEPAHEPVAQTVKPKRRTKKTA